MRRAARIGSDPTGHETYRAIRRECLRDGAVGYWPLNERPGNDAALNDVDPTQYLTWGSIPEFRTTGHQWPAVTLTSDSATSSLNADYNPTNFSVEIWAYRTATGLLSVASYATTGNPSSWGFDTLSDRWRFYMTDSTGGTTYREAPSPVAIVNNTWVHLLATYDHSLTRALLYVDGVLVGSDSTGAGSKDTTTRKIFLGRYNDTYTQYWVGRLAHLSFYPSVLSADRVRHRFLIGAGRRAA